MKIKEEKNYIFQYIIYTYGLFLLLLLTLGGIAKVLLHGTPLVMRWLIVITAWTSTFVFLLMFKKLYPNSTVKDFYKNVFTEKLNIRLLVLTTLIQILIFILSVYMVSTQKITPTINFLDFTLPTVISALFFTLIQGATGEETGWRGYLLPAIEKKIGIVKGSLIVSLIWSFWHAPIWFLGTGYSGTVLYKYIIMFVICITSLGFIIGICYHRCKNLFVPIWIHFTFNFLGELFKGSMADLITWYAIFYFIMAVGFFLWFKSNYNFLKSKNSAIRKRGIKKIIILIICFFGSIVLFFSIPYSKTHTEFISIRDKILKDTVKVSDIFTEEDVKLLPSPVKKYFYYCGYIGTSKMYTIKGVYKDVKFLFGKGERTIIIDYTQYNFVNEPARIAYIDSSMYGIPFEGLDLYTAGNGSMKGILAKVFTLFNQTGETMDKASLVTFLSEILIIPNAALQDYIVWEEIDTLHAKATISYHGQTASGIFTFNEIGEMISFTTHDRKATSTDGKSEEVKWSIVLGEYKETKGIKKPTKFQAIWHYDDGDLIYFDGENVAIEYNMNE